MEKHDFADEYDLCHDQVHLLGNAINDTCNCDCIVGCTCKIHSTWLSSQK